MSGNLTVALTVLLKNLLRRDAGQLRSDLRGMKDEAKGLSSIKGPNVAGMAAFGAEARRSAIALRELKREQIALGRAGMGQNTVLAGTGRFALALGGIAAGGYAGRQAIGATVGQSISFEKAMAQVRKKVDAPDEAGFQRLETTINRIAKDYGLARAQVAELTAEAGASGIAFQDLERFMRMTAKAAVAWDMSAPEASQKLAEIKTGTQMTIAELEKLAEKINGLGDNSAAKERDIVEMFGRAGAAAKAAGVSFDVSLAALTAVRSTGLQPEIASRWFAAFTGGLRTIEEGSKKSKEGLKLLGLDATKVANGMKTDALGTMLDIFDRLQKSPEAATAAIKIFGKEWWDETSRAAQALPELKKQLEFLKSGKWEGSLNKTLNIELATTANHLERLKSLASEVGDRMGRWALPGINSTIDAMIKRFDELSERFEAKWGDPDKKKEKTPEFTHWTDPVVKPAFDWLGRQIFGEKLTKDAARQAAETGIGTAADAEALARKQTEEAAILRVQAANAKKKEDKARLTIEAGKKEQEAIANSERADRASREAAQALGRDMTNVEAGTQSVPAVVEKYRTIRAEMERLQGVIAGSNPNSTIIRDDASGRFWRRDALQAQIDSLKEKLGELPPKAQEAGDAVKDKLTLDLTGQGSNAGLTWAAGLRSAIPAVEAAALALRAPIMTPAVPVAGAGGRPASGGGANRGGSAPTVQVGGITIHSSGDPEKTARLVEQRLASAIRSGLSGAHHDGVV